MLYRNQEVNVERTKILNRVLDFAELIMEDDTLFSYRKRDDENIKEELKIIVLKNDRIIEL